MRNIINCAFTNTENAKLRSQHTKHIKRQQHNNNRTPRAGVLRCSVCKLLSICKYVSILDDSINILGSLFPFNSTLDEMEMDLGNLTIQKTLVGCYEYALILIYIGIGVTGLIANLAIIYIIVGKTSQLTFSKNQLSVILRYTQELRTIVLLKTCTF